MTDNSTVETMSQPEVSIDEKRGLEYYFNDLLDAANRANYPAVEKLARYFANYLEPLDKNRQTQAAPSPSPIAKPVG